MESVPPPAGTCDSGGYSRNLTFFTWQLHPLEGQIQRKGTFPSPRDSAELQCVLLTKHSHGSVCSSPLGGKQWGRGEGVLRDLHETKKEKQKVRGDRSRTLGCSNTKGKWLSIVASAGRQVNMDTWKKQSTHIPHWWGLLQVWKGAAFLFYTGQDKKGSRYS